VAPTSRQLEVHTIGDMGTGKLDDRGIVVECPQCGQSNRLVYARLAAPLRCGRCKYQLGAPGAPVEVERSADFDWLVGLSSVPVVVDYWAPWCAPCRMVAPELEKLAKSQAGRLVVAKVNTDALSDLGERFGIRSIPTLAVFVGGRETARLTGAHPAREIETFVAQATHRPGHGA
jgi:thioredoxin 2